MDMMKKHNGQSLGEYALLLGLIALIAIPALILFGGNLSDLFTNIKPGGANVLSGPSSAALAPATSAPATTTAPAAGSAPVVASSAPVSSPTAQMTASYDPKTKQITFQVSDGSSSGKTTTGAQGTEMASLALIQLAHTATKDDGTLADPGILNLISQLGKQGQLIGNNEQGITATPLSSPWMQQTYNSGIFSNYQQYVNIYNQLDAAVKNDPSYSKLFQQVNDLSGVVGTTAVYSYLGAYQNASTTEMNSNIAGTNAINQSVTIPLDSGSTQTAASGITTLGGSGG